MTRVHTDLSRVAISVAPSPATSGTSLGVTDANAAYLPDTYPFWAVLVPVNAAPTRANSEIVKVTAGSSSGGTTTYTIVRAQGTPVTTAQTVTTSFDIYDANSAEANIGLNSLMPLETLSGTVNGSNTAFDTSTTYVAGSIHVFRDGQLMAGGGADYTETDTNTVTFTTAPVTGSLIQAWYQHTVSTTGNADTVDGYHASNNSETDGTLVANYGGWIVINDTLSYSSADSPTFVISTTKDLTGVIGVGMRIKLTQTTAKYFIVTAITSSTITVYGGTDYTLANAAISSPYFSYQKAPLGFTMDVTKWTVRTANTGTNRQGSPSASTWYNSGPITIVIPIGSWHVSYQACLASDLNAATQANFAATLSTANNSESDADLSCQVVAHGVVSYVYTKVMAAKQLTLTSKTTYYLNSKTETASTSFIGFYGAGGTTVILAICAYL